MRARSRTSLLVALGLGAAGAWLIWSGQAPLGHTVIAASSPAVAAPSPATYRTPSGGRVSLLQVAGGAPAARRAAPALAAQAAAAGKKPNILVIFGDDVGQTNISAYSFGVVGDWQAASHFISNG